VAQQSMYFANKTPSNFVDAGVNYDFPLNTNLISAKWDGNTVFCTASHERHGTAIVLKQGHKKS
jgi:hypothetical protein